MRPLRELFPLFFDPRAPLLFLVGSLALSILGTAVYELLAQAFGVAPQTLVAILVGATAIFVFVAWSVQRLVGALQRRGGAGDTLVSEEQRAEPHAALILPVGLNREGPERNLISFHLRAGTLRHCWLIVSPEVAVSSKLADLRQWLLERNVETHLLQVSDANQADQSYTAVRDGIRAARNTRGAEPLLVDITSGVKAMTAGMVLACRDEGVALQYLPSVRDDAGNPRVGQVTQPMKVQVGEGGAS